MFHGCGRPQLGRRRRSVNPKFQVNEEVGLFDDVITPNIGEYSLEDGSDNFSFDDEPVDHAQSEKKLPVAPLNRIRRDAAVPASNSREVQFESLKFDTDKDASVDNAAGSTKRRKNKNRQPSAPSTKRKDDDSEENKEPVLDKLVKDIRQKVKDSRKFWSNLPYQICNNEDFAAPSSSDANCWNGNSVDR